MTPAGPHLIIDLGEEEKRRVDKLIETGEGKLARKIQALVERALAEDGEPPAEGEEIVPVVLVYQIKRKKTPEQAWKVTRGW